MDNNNGSLGSHDDLSQWEVRDALSLPWPWKPGPLVSSINGYAPLSLPVPFNEILPFPRIRGPPFFLRPSPTVKLHLPPSCSSSSRMLRENNIAPHLVPVFVKIYLRCRTMITSFAWETGLIHQFDDAMYVLETGPRGKRIYNVVLYIYICICGGDLNYTDRYFRG